MSSNRKASRYEFVTRCSKLYLSSVEYRKPQKLVKHCFKPPPDRKLANFQIYQRLSKII